ncbi:hypothetical protein [Oceanobacillus halotolerans]|uniref:hypothetical protein n=1 Tax=Oceanobacillus halotolerans TaxID=2663380 RepID=UPI0013DC72ED|nr:hypothetical protein [Oceanobacillus halotolerans]
MGQINIKGVIWLFISGICFVVSIFFPWWALRLVAPQYKEGLYIWVYPYKMDGEIDIINSLNHYIGMKEFSEASFPELDYLPYIIGGIAFITIIIALIRNRTALMIWTGVVLVLAMLGVYDIYRWLRTFGTNLDPSAPINIDPFIPPIVGTNQLANFETFSFFSYGAVLCTIAIIILLIVLWKGKERHV